MPRREKIYLIGFMGSGKSTAGKKLAAKLSWSFIDLDKKIEENTGMSIPEIFSIHGEGYFREKESEALKELQSEKEIVVATGGGAPCYNDNMDLMISTGLTIYLRLTPEQLRNRLAVSKTERPLLKGLRREDFLTYIKEKLSQREIFYNKSEIKTEAYELDLDELHNRVIETLQ